MTNHIGRRRALRFPGHPSPEINCWLLTFWSSISWGDLVFYSEMAPGFLITEDNYQCQTRTYKNHLCLYTWPWPIPGSRKKFMVPCNSHNLMKKTDYPFFLFFFCFLWERGYELYFSFRIGLRRWFSGKEFAKNAGDPGSAPGSGRSPGEGNGNPLQYSCLKNPMDRGTWGLQSMGMEKNGTWLSN